MTNLASFSALNEKVKRIQEDEKLESPGHAFMRLGLQTILKINDDEIEDSTTNGSMDGEIDAIYIENSTINIFTFKYTDNFEHTKKNYPESELDQFILTTDRIISGSLDKKTINPAVWEKYKEILDLSTGGRIDFKLFVVSNKLKPVKQAKLKLENTLDKFRILQKPYYYDQEDLVSLIIENRVRKINGSLSFVDTQHFEKSNGDIKTVIGVISGSDLVKLIQSENDPNEVDEDAFNENVRVYKPNHRVNKAIIESGKSDDNYQFFYLNNGITLLCEECNYKPFTKSPYVELKNFQIINGGQTSHSIFEINKTNPDKIRTLELLIRICMAKKGNPISELISETSNSQIPVGSRDLHSNDIVQKKLEAEFESIGYFYERKPNQYFDKPKDQRLNNELLAQLYLAYHFDMPSEAKNTKSLVFGNMYDQIFDEDRINAKELLKIYKIYLPILEMKKIIQRKKRKKEPINELESFISRATFHIMNTIKFIIEDREKSINESDLEQDDKNKQIEKIYEKNVHSIIKKAIGYINNIVKNEIKIRGDIYTHDKFFKEIPTNQIIKTFVLKKINSKN